MSPVPKRELILSTAEKIMAKKGMFATISEISQSVGAPDSSIYRYFKNKEDLLFSVAEENLRLGGEALMHHLEGIVDPVSRLRKVIWYSLHYNETHQDFSRLILFDCRSNKNFMNHPAFGYIRRSLGLMRGILQDGVKEGLFREDLHVPVVRDAINGLLDIQCIQRLTSAAAPPLADDVEDIMSLVLPMISRSREDEAPCRDKSERLLLAAERIFAGQGFEHSRIQEIAQAAGVAEGTVYDYFKNKEDLLFSTIKKRLTDHLVRSEQLFEVRTPVRKLRRFIRFHFSTYLEQTDFVKNFILHGVFNRGFYESDLYPTFKKYLEKLADILDEGRGLGDFRPEINGRIFENLFVGAFVLMTLRWVFIRDYPGTDQLKEIDQVVDLLTRAAVVGPVY